MIENLKVQHPMNDQEKAVSNRKAWPLSTLDEAAGN